MNPMPVEQCVHEGDALERNKPTRVPGVLNRFMTGLTTRGILSRSTSVWMWGTMLAKSVRDAAAKKTEEHNQPRPRRQAVSV